MPTPTLKTAMLAMAVRSLSIAPQVSAPTLNSVREPILYSPLAMLATAARSASIASAASISLPSMLESIPSKPGIRAMEAQLISTPLGTSLPPPSTPTPAPPKAPLATVAPSISAVAAISICPISIQLLNLDSAVLRVEAISRSPLRII
jgi:hypothetical protein